VSEFTKRYWLLVLSVVGLVTGLVAWAAGNDSVADAAWAATTVLTLVPVTIGIARQLIQRRAAWVKETLGRWSDYPVRMETYIEQRMTELDTTNQR